MLTSKINAAFILRNYVWKLLDTNTNLELINTQIEGKSAVLIPVALFSDEPLLANSGKTYLLYGWIENEPDDGYHRVGTISFRIIAQTGAELVEIANALYDTFEFEDWAAQDVNRWSSTQPAFARNVTPEGVRFTSVCPSYMQIGDAERIEGGPVEGVVNLRYKYIREHSPITLPV